MSRTISLLLTSFILARPAAACPDEVKISGEKDVNKQYRILRSDPTCHDKESVHMQFMERALLAGRVAEAIWSGELLCKSSCETAARILLGLAYLEANRNEEAISSLKDPALNADPATRRYNEEALLALIKAYWQRAGHKEDENTKYLKSLFLARHGRSQAAILLRDWKP